MKPKHFVIISIPCQSTEELQKAKEAVLFHLETLNPDFTAEGTTLTVKVVPLDPQLFLPDEACDIIRQTLAQSITRDDTEVISKSEPSSHTTPKSIKKRKYLHISAIFCTFALYFYQNELINKHETQTRYILPRRRGIRTPTFPPH